MGILVKPIVTEKVASLNDKGVYGFVVQKSANKVEIRKEIEKTYNVHVLSVNTVIQRGKTKQRNTKSSIISGRTSSFKKAIVKVASGEVIDFYSVI